MYPTIVIAFSTLDGVVEDPDGTAGTPGGGWAFRHGPETVSGDKFELGPVLETGVLVLGRTTWELFSHIWPARTDDFSVAMNRIPKLVASRTEPDLSCWTNSSLLQGDVVEAIGHLKADREVVVAGSASIVHALGERGLVDEYRLLVFPELVGQGTRLFTDRTAPATLRLLSVARSGPTTLVRYERDGR